MSQWPAELKKTKHRSAVMSVLENAKTPMSVDEIYDALKASGDSVWLSTIYRILDSLLQYQVINKINISDQQAVYKLNKHTHSHYAICLNCKKIIELDHCALSAYQEMLNEKHFLVKGHKIEIYGLCQKCQNKVII